MAQLLRNQRTYCNSSSSMHIWHSDRPLWSYVYRKCKMVVSLKGLQDPSRGTKLVCVKCHHRWCTELTGSSLMVVSITDAVNGIYRSWYKNAKNFWSYQGKILRDHSLEWLMGSFYTNTHWSYSREIATPVSSSVLRPTSMAYIIYGKILVYSCKIFLYIAIE